MPQLDDVFALRESLKFAEGTWYTQEQLPLPVAPITPLLVILQGGDIGAGKSRVVTILIWKIDRWYTRFIDIGMIGTDLELPSIDAIIQWKFLNVPLPGTGLRGDYFENISLSGTPEDTQYENVSFVWNNQPPVPGFLATNFSIRWSGLIFVDTTGDYLFRSVNRDGVRLTIDGITYINDWNVHTSSQVNNTGLVTLVQGYTPITFEYFLTTGGGEVHLFLSTGSIFTIIPKANLYVPGYIS